MSFGFKSINDNRYVQIDADSPRLCCLEKGSYGGSNYVATVTFARPITTVEPPMIFIRPSQTSNNELYRSLALTGSAGNWTGFQVAAQNIDYQPTGLWFAAVFASRGTSTFGMRLFKADGSMIYDTSAAPVIVTAAFSTWSYLGSVQLAIGQNYKWTCGRGLGAGEYMMINDFASCCQGEGGSSGTCAISCNYATNQTFMWSQTTSAWTNQGERPLLMAKLTT